MLKINAFLFILVCALSACTKADEGDNKPVDEKPAFDIAPQRAQLQRAKEFEKKMQQDVEDRRKKIELQTNPQ